MSIFTKLITLFRGTAHEAGQRRESTDTQHDQVACFTRADGDLWQAGGASFFSGEGSGSEQQRF